MFHRWIGTDDPAHDTCLTCGGMWAVNASGAHVGIDGTPAVQCAGSAAQCHHYAGECPENECRRDDNCNCLHCFS